MLTIGGYLDELLVVNLRPFGKNSDRTWRVISKYLNWISVLVPAAIAKQET
jgi:hypothetical protein